MSFGGAGPVAAGGCSAEAAAGEGSGWGAERGATGAVGPLSFILVSKAKGNSERGSVGRPWLTPVDRGQSTAPRLRGSTRAAAGAGKARRLFHRKAPSGRGDEESLVLRSHRHACPDPAAASAEAR